MFSYIKDNELKVNMSNRLNKWLVQLVIQPLSKH